MFESVLETKTAEETIADRKVVAVVRAATWGDVTKIETVFMELVYMAMQNSIGPMISGMDTVISQLCEIKVDGESLNDVKALPVPFVLKLAEAVIELNFTSSNVAAWQSLFTRVGEAIAKATPENESVPKP